MEYIKTKGDLQDFLMENKVLIQYTKDSLGYRNGVVVSVAKDIVTFSKMSSQEEKFGTVKVTSTPLWGQLKEIILENDAIFGGNDASVVLEKVKNVLGDASFYAEPDFSRFVALKIAINRGLKAVEDGVKPSILDSPYSINDDWAMMAIRSNQYFKYPT